MSGSRPRRHRTPRARAKLLLGAAAAACAALTIGALVPVFASAHPGGPAGMRGASVSTSAYLAGRHRRGRGGTPTPTPAPAPPPANADPNPNCTLVVPPAPLSAAGLATPYRFVASDPRAGACHEANTDQSAFVEAAILDPATGRVSVYHPLVIDEGTQPAVAPVRPTLPRGAVVGVWFGFQANDLTLRHRHLRRGFMTLRYRASDGCVNGTPGSPFGQFAYCGAPQFFTAANAAIRAGKLAVPALGTGKDGQPCPTTRDFGVVDQDQSDNLPTEYLATSDGRTAQFSAANRAALPGATVLTNASDNGLVDNKLDPVLGCRPPTAPDLSAGGAPSPALALNELQAAADQRAPVALVPPNDPMAQVNGATNIAKTNLYRAGVDQRPVNRATDTGAAYCTNLATVAVPRLALDETLTSAAPSPDPGVAADLHGFLVARLNDSWGNLGCPALTGAATPADAAAKANPATPANPADAAAKANPATPAVAPTPTPAATPAAAAPTAPAAASPPGTDPAAAATATASGPAGVAGASPASVGGTGSAGVATDPAAGTAAGAAAAARIPASAAQTTSPSTAP